MRELLKELCKYDWIMWHGGECPVHGQVDVILRSGGVRYGRRSESLIWSHFHGLSSEIVAYREHGERLVDTMLLAEEALQIADSTIDVQADTVKLQFETIEKMKRKIAELSGEWVKWEGGECPTNALVEIRTFDGRTVQGRGNYFHWDKEGKIAAYRIIQDDKAEIERLRKALADEKYRADSCQSHAEACIADVKRLRQSLEQLGQRKLEAHRAHIAEVAALTKQVKERDALIADLAILIDRHKGVTNVSHHSR